MDDFFQSLDVRLNQLEELSPMDSLIQLTLCLKVEEEWEGFLQVHSQSVSISVSSFKDEISGLIVQLFDEIERCLAKWKASRFTTFTRN